MTNPEKVFTFASPNWVWGIRIFSGVSAIYFVVYVGHLFTQIDTSGIFIFLITASMALFWAYWFSTSIKLTLRSLLASQSRKAWVEGEQFVLETQWRYPEFIPSSMRASEYDRWFGNLKQLLPEWVGHSLFLELGVSAPGSPDFMTGKCKVASGNEARTLTEWLQRFGLTILEPN